MKALIAKGCFAKTVIESHIRVVTTTAAEVVSKYTKSDSPKPSKTVSEPIVTAPPVESIETIPDPFEETIVTAPPVEIKVESIGNYSCRNYSSSTSRIDRVEVIQSRSN